VRGERLGIAAAVLSSTLGGINSAATRFAVGATDPVTLAALRFGLGFFLLLPAALALCRRWPPRRDWLGVAALGILFFAIFMSVFNLALHHTTAARGALALSTLPLLTMAVAALLRIETLTLRKSVGVTTAIGGVAVALIADLGKAPADAWRGDLIMVAGSLCMALYNVWSRPFIARSSPLAFVTAGMGAGSACLLVIASADGGLAASGALGWPQWAAILYLSTFGAALTFFLWVLALARTTPTRVASTITINPVAASLVAVPLIGEPIGFALLAGAGAVAAGIWIASTEPRQMQRHALTEMTNTGDRRRSSNLRSASERRSWWPHPSAEGCGRRIPLWCEPDGRYLANLDDRMLRDIGIDRAVIDDDSTVSFWRLR
jgi:drug/metabolite transporter (DMT)-like permease